MLRVLSNASAGMRQEQQKTDVIANNVANLNTTAFRGKKAVFRELLYQSVERRGNAVKPADPGEPRIAVGTGSAMGAIRGDMQHGALIPTGRETDFALEGEGYFQLLLPDGRLVYTRDGSFSRDSQGNLVNAQGYALDLPAMPAFSSEMAVDSDGTARIINEAGEWQEAGRLILARFNNPQGLEHLGGSLYLATEASGPAREQLAGESIVIRQGYLESSNVGLGREMAELLVSQRAFQLNSRMAHTGNEMWELANQVTR